MRRWHLLPCLLVAAIAAVILAAGGGSTFTFSAALVLLICPLTMGAAMWLLMRGPRGHEDHQDCCAHTTTKARP